ncbi:hypothetical protein GKZ68_10950 [Hymenobacter sp. BRD128]|uniref:hypothetical protein n=1 Tax=Hymenobacter sp. BRD128 TaxID=2675878 RepID=UPI00156364FE|nr:hypothetical protein [Hymenobacter sp. BRD128]QKG57101.1 hypothetical protein GKZ68_10950 [Hymenobacter sp. BRD128]
MRTLPRLFGLLLLGLLSGLLLLSSCETTRRRESSDPTREAQRLSDAAGASLSGSASSHQIMHLDGKGTVKYKLSQAVMAAALIRQFNDGTVIDRIMVRKAPGSEEKQPVYYLIGMGHNNGAYRAVALPLRGTDDSTYYLTPTASRYVITGVGCPSCYFDFEDGHIVGTTCDDNSGGSSCTMKVLAANEVFAKTPLEDPTDKKKRK